eukprot:15468398-Alexandrium_andersonii.AAC.1
MDDDGDRGIIGPPWPAGRTNRLAAPLQVVPGSMPHPRELCKGSLNCHRAALLADDLRNGRGPVAQIDVYRGRDAAAPCAVLDSGSEGNEN